MSTRGGVVGRLLHVATTVVVGTAALTGLLPIGAADAEGPGSSFRASASGNLVVTTFAVSPAILFDTLLDPGSALAQASVNSLGDARGYAASTTPGTTFDALGGLAGTATGGQVGEGQVPKNPASVRSIYPTIPEQSKSAGPVVLSSRSQGTGTVASSSDGSNTGTAMASVDPISGTLTAQSETTVQKIVVSPLLSLNGVRSSASAERGSDGLITLGSSFSVTSITVNGTTVALGRSGLDVIGQQQSFDPATAALRPVLTELASAGIAIETFPERTSRSSVESAGVRITVPLTAPAAAPLNGATVTYTFGGSSAMIDSGGTGDMPVAVAAPPIAAGPAPVTAAITPTRAGVGATGPAIAGGGAGTPAVAPVPAASTGLRLPLDATGARFYPVLLLAAAALFAATRLFRPVTGGTP